MKLHTIAQNISAFMKRILFRPVHLQREEREISGRIRIEVDGKEVLNKAYHSQIYRYHLIEQTKSKYEKISAIYISPDEQSQAGSDTYVDRRGVSNIINYDGIPYYDQ